MLAATGISKRFGATLANDSVDLELVRGSVHAVLGQNGAGKTTLANILSGLYRPDAGSLSLDGEPLSFGSPLEALRHGVAMVHQHPLLVDRLSVEENIVLGDRRLPYRINRRAIREKARVLAEGYGLSIPLGARAGGISAGERQRVELCKVMYRGIDVLILDEPTAVLTPPEVDRLFHTIRSFADDGVSVMIITHKLREVIGVSDTVTVLRDGRVEMVAPTADTTPKSLTKAMIGRAISLASPDGVPEQRDENRKKRRGTFTATDIRVHSAEYESGLNGVSMEVNSGEILGVAGVAGNGQDCLADVLAGLVAPGSGEVVLNGIAIHGKGPQAARDHGLRYVPSDRLRKGLAPDLTIAENMMLVEGSARLDWREARRRAAEAIAEYEIAADGPDVKTRRLSGGNLQRVLLARELSGSPAAVVVASPTQGLDVGSVQFVHRELRRLRDAGSAVVLISEDLDEIMALADDVVVISEGTFKYESPVEDLDYDLLGLAMAGADIE